MNARFILEEAEKSLVYLENFTTVRKGIAGGSASRGTRTPLRTQGQERLSERAAKAKLQKQAGMREKPRLSPLRRFSVWRARTPLSPFPITAGCKASRHRNAVRRRALHSANVHRWEENHMLIGVYEIKVGPRLKRPVMERVKTLASGMETLGLLYGSEPFGGGETAQTGGNRARGRGKGRIRFTGGTGGD